MKLQFHESIIHITTVVDNLLKGASGQAVQNMNTLYNFSEKMGFIGNNDGAAAQTIIKISR